MSHHCRSLRAVVQPQSIASGLRSSNFQSRPATPTRRRSEATQRKAPPRNPQGRQRISVVASYAAVIIATQTATPNQNPTPMDAARAVYHLGQIITDATAANDGIAIANPIRCCSVGARA